MDALTYAVAVVFLIAFLGVGVLIGVALCRSGRS
jgi:hypothetical protein